MAAARPLEGIPVLFVGYEESRHCRTMINGRRAQQPVIRRRLGDRVVSTGPGTEGMRQ